jgi:hypothetical protein
MKVLKTQSLKNYFHRISLSKQKLGLTCPQQLQDHWIDELA